MLDKLDLTKKTETTKYEATLEEYIDKLSILQRTLREQKIPVIIVIEGWNASGITMTVHEIVHALDPRGYTL
ncbi:MAG: phosphate--AMP phosphotransferase, partial [Chloroherpetonaceae bacterium]